VLGSSKTRSPLTEKGDQQVVTSYTTDQLFVVKEKRKSDKRELREKENDLLNASSLTLSSGTLL
jgi:hypothetical protein